MWTALMILSAAAAEPSAHLMSHANADYAITSSQAQYTAIAESAVDAYLEPMNFAVRAFANAKLVDAALPCEGYQIALVGEQFSVSCDGKLPIVVVDGSAPISYTADSGKIFQLSVTFFEAELLLKFKGEDADQTTRYRFSESGALTVQREIYPHSLGATLRVSYDYTKTP